MVPVIQPVAGSIVRPGGRVSVPDKPPDRSLNVVSGSELLIWTAVPFAIESPSPSLLVRPLLTSVDEARVTLVPSLIGKSVGGLDVRFSPDTPLPSGESTVTESGLFASSGIGPGTETMIWLPVRLRICGGMPGL